MVHHRSYPSAVLLSHLLFLVRFLGQIVPLMIYHGLFSIAIQYMGAVNWESQTATKIYVHKAPKVQHTYSCGIPQAAVVQHSTYAKEIFIFQQTEMK